LQDYLRAENQDLSAVVRAAAKRNRRLFPGALIEQALRTLRQRGLAEQRTRRVMLVSSRQFTAPTEEGRRWAEQAGAALERAQAPATWDEQDPARVARLAQASGIFVLLVPGGVAQAARLARRLRASEDSAWDATAWGLPSGEDFEFDALRACDQSFGDVFAGIDGAMSSLDTVLSSVASSIDSAIDSGVDAGGGGGDSGGGDGGGGGGGD